METNTRRGPFGRLLRWTLSSLLLAAIAIGGFGYLHYRDFARTPVAAAAGERVMLVDRGDGFGTVLAKLRRAGITQGSDLEWQLLARQLGTRSRLQVGEYDLAAALTPAVLLDKLQRGDVVQRRFTLVEGWNIRQLRTALAALPALRRETASLSDAQLMQALDRPGQHPEGRFLPETYRYTRDSSDLDLLRRAHRAMESALAQAWAQRAADLPLKTPDEALTLASIVEKETGVAPERAQIAGVFVRRLALGMLLQTDPTVIYGIGQGYDGNIRRIDLETDTPYNTYRRVGLPPTPIAMPGRAALNAATRPQPSDALYFVSRGDGTHVFSATLADHNRAVQCYQRERC